MRKNKTFFCETYLRDICVCEGSWHLAMSFFCYHFPFGETQKAWHRNPTKEKIYRVQKTKEAKLTKDYRRKNLQKKKFYRRRKNTKEKYF